MEAAEGAQSCSSCPCRSLAAHPELTAVSAAACLYHSSWAWPASCLPALLPGPSSLAEISEARGQRVSPELS